LAADTLFSILDDLPVPENLRKEQDTAPKPNTQQNTATDSELEIGSSLAESPNPMFPLIKGILAFDTPYNSLARSMFVYGAFSQYQKVSNMWNIMSAVSAGLMSSTALTGSSAHTLDTSVAAGDDASWKLWQKLAIRTGTAGAIAAGGAAAYMNREKLADYVKNLDKNSVGQGLKYGQDALGQGLAYINRESLGQGFAWVSSHLHFIGALMKQKQLGTRLQRLAAIEGIGIANLYSSMGQNGYWTGGYFVPERTFCAVPPTEENASKIFVREINGLVDDEINAHVTMFRPEKNDGYEKMCKDARDLVISWFRDTSEVVDPLRPSDAEREEEEKAEEERLQNRPEGESGSD
jgi:hypothetical protein